jgi:BirA family biotin operon repressor/biotin-[acetyl-CoA-carboxylase] ligase
MIIGVGMNLRNAYLIEQSLHPSATKVSSLEQLLPTATKLPELEYLWLKLLESFEYHFRKFDQRGFAVYQQEWLKWDAFPSQRVCITDAGKGPIYGVAQGVDTNGALLLQQEDNTIAVYAGDVSLRVQS